MRKQYHVRNSKRGRLIWDVDRLVKLTENFETREIPLDCIQELDENFWFQNKKDIPTCRAIAEHAKLIRDSDLRHPVILSSGGRVMDGMHRISKAYMQGDKTVTVVQFKKDPEPDYVDVDLDDLPY